MDFVWIVVASLLITAAVVVLVRAANKAEERPRQDRRIIAVVDVESGERWPSVRACARALNRDWVSVARVLDHGARRCAGRLLAVDTTVTTPPRWRPPKPVRDLDTNEIWPSVRAAADAIGVSASSVHASLRAGCRCHGRRIAYAEAAQ